MNDQVTDPEQGLLLDLPALAPPPTTIAATRDLNTPSAATPSALTTLETLFDLVPDVVPRVMLVDPRAIAVDPVNIRVGVAFDAAARGELIASMRRIGNTVPMRLRPDPTGSRGYLCPSGSQRLGAALHIQQDVADFRLRAIVAETMTDDEAFALGEADNAGRSGVSAMQQARHWQTALASVYRGNRQAFIAATGRSASIVSRTLALLSLPDYVLTCCGHRGVDTILRRATCTAAQRSGRGVRYPAPRRGAGGDRSSLARSGIDQGAAVRSSYATP